MMQDLESYEKDSKSIALSVAEENRAILFNLRLLFSASLTRHISNSTNALSYVTRCLVAGTRCESRDVVLMCLRNICSFQDDTIRAYMSTTNLLIRAVQVTPKSDSCYVSETLSVLLDWFDRSLVSTKDIILDFYETVWKLMSSCDKAIRTKATQIVCIFISKHQEYRPSAKDVEILATLCSGDTCLKVCIVW